MGVNSLPKTVTRQHHGCDLNPGPTARPESSTLTTWLPSHPNKTRTFQKTHNMFFNLFRNLVKPSEMPRPLALTGITAHTQTHTQTLYIKWQNTKKINRQVCRCSQLSADYNFSIWWTSHSVNRLTDKVSKLPFIFACGTHTVTDGRQIHAEYMAIQHVNN